jgi:polysaccharide deacetylase 2 family uncharacterized protein YibQ
MATAFLTFAQPSDKVHVYMARKSRRIKNRRWLGLLGLAFLLVFFTLAAARLKPVLAPILSSLRGRPQASLNGLKVSLDSMSTKGWQSWFQAQPDSGPSQWRVTIPADRPLVSANLAVHRLSAIHGITVVSATEDRRRGLLEILLAGEEGHFVRLVIRKRPVKESSSDLPRLSLVAYEVAGDWPAQRKKVASCPAVMTVAGGSRVRDSGREIIAFLPLEPKGYPKQDPGPNTLLVDDGPAAIRSKLSRICSGSPGAVGLFVHYGSRAVEDGAVMDEVAKFCKDKDLILVEPAPTSASLASVSCRKAGAVYFTSDVYLGKTASLQEAKTALARALKSAESRGRSLALLPATENALRAAREMFPQGKNLTCRLVPLSRLKDR